MMRVLPLAAAIFLAAACAPLEQTGVGTIDPNAPPEQQARVAAEAWIGMVDRGAFRDAWEEAARSFKRRVTPGQFEQSVRNARLQFGTEIASREYLGHEFRAEIPESVRGEYVMLQYRTTFSRGTARSTAIETIVVMRDEGLFRGAGYFLRPG
jgi:hypothetical protein